jgi:acetolactate decarboxylase
MLDGVVYRANADLEIEIPADNELIPFSNVTFFDNDEEYQLKDIKDIASLKKQLDSKVNEL